MRSTPILLLVCLSTVVARGAPPQQDTRWGTLIGRFVYDGPRPDPPPLVVPAGRLGKMPNPVDETLLVDAQGGLCNVLLFVRTKDVPVHPRRLRDLPPRVVLESKGLRFEPHILALTTAQTLVIRNSDPFAINANVTEIGGPGMNPLLAPAHEATYKFRQVHGLPQPVTSNIQPWYKAYILPCGNPYFAISQTDGTFALHGLPLGEFEFQAWHEVPGFINTPDWPKGRFRRRIEPGENDLGTIKLLPKVFKR